MQPIEIMYDAMRDEIVRDTMACRATEEPMLMSERQTVTPRETRTALRGIFQPGDT